MSLSISPKKVLTVFILLILLVSSVIYWSKEIHPYEITNNAYLKAHVSLISPKQSGYVKEVLFKDNQKVKQGDLLVVIDDHDFQVRVAQAETQVLLEKARIQTLEAEKLTQHAKIKQELANISASKADLEKTKKDLTRFNHLVKEGAVSAQTRDLSESSYKQANAQFDKVQSAQQEAESELAVLNTQIQEARVRIKAAEAALELARIDLINTRIVAPISGIIGNRSVQVGQLVQIGHVLGHLIPENDVFIDANFKETQIADMQLGQVVEIKIDAYPEQLFIGAVDSFSPASGAEFSLLPAENATGNFTKIVRRVPIKIMFQAGTDLSRLKPGLSVEVKVKVR